MKYDLLHIHQKTSVLKLEGNKINALKNVDMDRFGMRRFENGKMFQTSRLGHATLDRLIADTKEWGGPGTPHDFGFAPEHKESRKNLTVSADNFKVFKEKALEMVKKYPHYIFTGSCQIDEKSVDLKSDYGLDLHSRGGVCSWYLMYQRKDSGNMIDGWIEESNSSPDIQGEITRHLEFLDKQTVEVPLKSGRYPILFSSPLGPAEKFKQSILIQNYSEGSAFFSKQLNEKIFSDKLTIVDRAYHPTSGNFQYFDGEGVVRPQNELKIVDKGVFTSLISDLRFAKKYKKISTGNGLRAYNTGVMVTPHSLAVLPGEKTWRDIIKDLDRCIVATLAAGGDSNDLGEYSTPVQIGYVFEKGQLVGRTPQITVKTSVKDYLGNGLIAVAKDGFVKSSPSACLISEVQVLVN